MIRVHRHIKHHVNLGDYEWLEESASVELDSEDYPGKTPEELLELAERMLRAHLTPALKAAAELTAEDNSYVHYVK